MDAAARTESATDSHSQSSARAAADALATERHAELRVTVRNLHQFVTHGTKFRA
jgi:hypothetical protein